MASLPLSVACSVLWAAAGHSQQVHYPTYLKEVGMRPYIWLFSTWNLLAPRFILPNASGMVPISWFSCTFTSVSRGRVARYSGSVPVSCSSRLDRAQHEGLRPRQMVQLSKSMTIAGFDAAYSGADTPASLPCKDYTNMAHDATQQ